MTTTTGRERFAKVRWLLLTLSAIAHLLPLRLRLWCWVLLDPAPDLLGVPMRYVLLHSMTKHCGDNVYVGRNVHLRHPGNLILGHNVSLHKDCYVDALGGITLGSDVSIAHASSLVSFDHGWDNPAIPIKYNPCVLKPIRIEDDVWVGCGVRVLGGVTIGHRSVIAAGAVVTNDVSPHQIVGGVPAKPLKELP